VSPDDSPRNDIAVLVSGGIDSTILCVDSLRRFTRVYPLHIRFGLRWEEVELACLRRFLDAVERPGLMPLHVLDEPIADVYAEHWSVGGGYVPGATESDESVYLPGRNLLLASKAAVWCRLRGIETLAFGILRLNPFPDGTPAFFQSLEATANRAMNGRLKIIRPYEGLDRVVILPRAEGLPLHLTFSCLNPVAGRHCGACYKCAERQKGFRDLGWLDRTEYATAASAADSRD
jgi:7-cyano-7-deazaguanine synthase